MGEMGRERMYGGGDGRWVCLMLVCIGEGEGNCEIFFQVECFQKIQEILFEDPSIHYMQLSAGDSLPGHKETSISIFCEARDGRQDMRERRIPVPVSLLTQQTTCCWVRSRQIIGSKAIKTF